MSFLEESSGLLGTHVNWEDIEDEVRLSLATEARFGENKRMQVVGEMKGIMSRIVLIHPDWHPKCSNLPEEFAVKIASPLNFIEMSKSIELGAENRKIDRIVRVLHNREVEAYRFLSENLPENFPNLKIYCAKKFSAENVEKGFLVLEFAENIAHISMFESIEIAEILPVVKAISKFSAIGYAENRLKFAAGPDFITHVLAEFGDVGFREKIYGKLRGMRGFFGGDLVKLENLIEIFRSSMLPENVAKLTRICEILGHPPVPVHGDLWPGNLLFTQGNPLKLRAIIDWQAVNFGSPAQDLDRLFISILSAKNRRENLDFLLGIYYQEFAENLEPPFTFEQLKKSYQLLFPIQAFMVLPGFLSMSEIPENSEIFGFAREKSIGMMEDVLKAHADNLLDFPGFFE
ncbi:unnamed protein product [Caenorhabditis angaria]|uniref:CHK kinase-like domain-containing protein n=1 Tax=Caenorhabditis angaria TaxID=860376 RepID=A0A9P1IVZ3_9PELO|nr:unnamed protein product [Caenorhabditis angaria]